MKKETFLLCALLLFACEQQVDGDKIKAREDIDLTRSQEVLVEKGNTFAFRLLGQVNLEESKENFCISPFSVSQALSMTLNGAAGNTATEMISALGFEGYTQSEINAYQQKMNQALLSLDPSTNIGIANSIWIREDFAVRKEFVDTNTYYFDAEVQNLPFDAAALNAINNWCDVKTKGRIDKILDDIDPDDIMFLLNALYFKGSWVHKFDKTKTEEADFYLAGGEKTKVNMMYQKAEFPYYEDETVQVVELPFGNEAFSMVFVLPRQGVDMDALIETLDAPCWANWLHRLRETELNLKLPRFNLEYEKELIPTMSALGMPSAFDSQMADFSLINADQDLYIGLLKQKTFVKVDEEGAEAAAVTIVGIKLTSAPLDEIHMTLDRPFLFVIKEKSTSCVLFMGRIGNPQDK
ncbi:MAG TPA: serpin family protein [Bacteroidales bacterium]|jgi:serpin B|nr:serpin family protein [Bacteroidales bacterium]HOD27125.1 serpin family protein [Bacteroidales bacterium]HQP23220.1 serpin family protein [Bacteroidales bacterium]